jgi:RNA-binding protein
MLTGKQKKILRGKAHSLKPVVQIGKNGLSDTVLSQIDESLDAHELVKIKLVDFKDEKREISEKIEESLKCDVCGIIGNTVIVFRQNKDPEKRKMKISNDLEG